MRHELKTHPEPFEAVVQGLKTFEYRYDDRGFNVGDELLLREWDPVCVVHPPPCGAAGGSPKCRRRGYTGREQLVEVTYLLRDKFGVRQHDVVMSIVRRDPADPLIKRTSFMSPKKSAAEKCTECGGQYVHAAACETGAREREEA